MNNSKDLYEIQKEVHNQLKQSTEKFSYYILALSVSSIAFVVHQTKDDKIDYPKILLLTAVFLWALSIYYGIHFIKKQQNGLLLSYRSYENLRNKLELSKDNPIKINDTEKIIKEQLKIISEKSKRNYKYQLNFFFSAVIFYISWHIIEMFQNTLLFCV